MKITAISDTHNLQHEMQHLISPCDVLLHAGDMCKYGDLVEVARIGEWLADLPARHVVIIAGNHDLCFEQDRYAAELDLVQADHVHYLRDSSVTIDGLKFYGSPWQPAFNNWAFNLPRSSSRLEDCWEQIPDDTDVLVTHGPPLGILDRCSGKHLGCELLRARVDALKGLKLHIFGHIHDDYGLTEMGHTQFCNASLCRGVRFGEHRYFIDNAPVVIEV